MDKCMAVLFPFFYRQHGKPKLCLICIVLMYFLIFVHASPSLFMYRISSRGSCRRFMYEVVPESVDQFRRDTLLYFVGIVPTVLVFTFTAITIYKIRGQNSAAKKRSNTTVGVHFYFSLKIWLILLFKQIALRIQLYLRVHMLFKTMSFSYPNFLNTFVKEIEVDCNLDFSKMFNRLFQSQPTVLV